MNILDQDRFLYGFSLTIDSVRIDPELVKFHYSKRCYTIDGFDGLKIQMEEHKLPYSFDSETAKPRFISTVWMVK
jgi:hypothetical protein